MDNRWVTFLEKFRETVTTEQLPVKLPRFDLDLSDLAGAAADWCHQYLKDRKCPSDLIVFLTKKVINNLRVKWAAEPKLFGYRLDKEDYQALWLMQRVIGELNEVCLNHVTMIPHHEPIETSFWWSSFVLKNARRQMEDYIAVVPYLHKLFDIEEFGEASFFAVYDGHNGLDAAVYSSMYFHQFLVQSIHYPTNPERALYEAFFTTDKGFTKKTEKYNLVSGTTAVCALLRPQEKKLYVGWVGDSIATLWKNGTPLCLVNKHVPDRHDETQRIENEGGMISKCQGIWRVDGQLAVSRAIGDVRYKPHITCQPEIRVLVLDGNEEFLVLGSDGLWEDTTPEDVAETIYDELLETDGDVSEVSNKLAFKSKALGSKDNISVITVFLQDPKQLVVKRRAAIMETAMEQRNATATLASYGQDTGDFGPETDVDTPDEPVGLTKPKAEGEENVVDESGEDSEEDGGGWNYYNKSTEGIEKKTHQEDDNNTGTNSDAEDMDYKLNPDAPEFVPVSSPTAPTMNRFLDLNDEEFISSSPQKFKESIDSVVVPDENDFTDEIKVHAADLSKLNIAHEPTDDSTMLNGINYLNDEETNHNESVDSFVIQNEQITNENIDKYQNPFVSDDKADLNKVQDLSEYINDDTQSFNTDPYMSIMETTKNNEINLTNDELKNESDVQLNDDSSVGEHLKYEQDMNSKNIDETINTGNATIGSSLQFDDDSFKHSDDYKNEFSDGNHIDRFGQNEDHKLNDSVSTTDAVVGSEPHTPMRMDNQSTFESENDEDQFSESFKQQLQFNQFDENNDKENHDPFCFETTSDPEGIIPNVSHQINEGIVDETHSSGDNVQPNDKSDEHQVSESTKHEPVEEPLCIKEKAKPIRSAYEQQYLPESDFSASTHEALLNATETEFNHHENNLHNKHSEQHDIVENNQVPSEHQNVDEHSEHFILEPKVPSTDDIKEDDSNINEHEFHHDNHKYNFEKENNSVGSVQHLSEKLEPENVNDEQKYVEQENHVDDYIQNQVEDYERHHQDIKISQNLEDFKQEHNDDVATLVQDYIGDLKQDNCDIATVQDHAKDFEQEFHNNYSEIKPYNVEDLKQDEVNVESVLNHKEDIVELVHNQTEEFEQKCFNNIPETENHFNDIKQELDDNVEVKNNFVEDFKQESHDVLGHEYGHVEDFKQEHHDVVEHEHNHTDDFKQEHHDVKHEYNHFDDFKQDYHNDVEVESNHITEDFKQEHKDVAEIVQNQNGDFLQEHQGAESVQNHTVDSDEEMHSSMIIHSDVENNTPQPYCSVSDTLINEPDMMCTSMTFEENFQNRNMSDSLYVMETSSDYFGEEVQPTTQLEKSVDEPKVEELLSNFDNGPVEPTKVDVNEIVSEAKSELVSDTKVEEPKTEIPESAQSSSQVPVEKVNEQEENNKVSEIAVAAAVGAAAVGVTAVAAATGISLASKKSAPKKPETSTVSKVKTSTTKSTLSKPLASKTLAPVVKKTLSSTTTSKPLSRPSTASSTSKAPTNVRPITSITKTTTLKATAAVAPKVSLKPATKTTLPLSRPTTAKTTPTTPKTTTVTKTTPISSPRTPTTPKTPVPPKSATTPKTTTTPRTNGSPKPPSRTVSAPARKFLSSATTNGTMKLTNGDASKTSTTTSKSPITLATRMSLAPPKLPPKAKTTSKAAETQPAMPGPIRRPNKAPTTKKTETATS